MSISPNRLAGLAPMFLALAVACSSPTEQGTEIPAISLTIVSGNGQSGPAGAELTTPLVVKAEAGGRLLRNYLITFRVTSGGGKMYSGTALTDSRGIAQDYWILGAPGPQQVDVVAVDPLTGQKQNFGTFTATAIAAPSASLTLSPDPHSFGALAVGATSAEQIFTVSNTGGAASGAIVLAITGVHDDEFGIATGTDNCTGQSLGTGQSCTVGMAFTPGHLGPSTATLSATGAPGVTASATLLGVGEPAPAALSIDLESIDFGSVAIGSSSPITQLRVHNAGPGVSGPLLVSLSGLDAAHFQISSDQCSGQSVNVGSFCQFQIRFSPQGLSSRNAVLNVTATPGTSLQSSLTGTGVNPVQLSVSTELLNFQSIGTNGTGQLPIVVTNNGSTDTEELTIQLISGDGSFSIELNECPDDLGPGDSCTVVVGFTPASLGVKTGNLAVTAANGGPASVYLAGAGVTGAEFTVSPDAWDFGEIQLDTHSEPVEFTVQNVGPVSAVVSWTIPPPEAEGFTSSMNVVAGGTCVSNTTVLGLNETCTIMVRFSPTLTNIWAGELKVSASPGNTTTVFLSGTPF